MYSGVVQRKERLDARLMTPRRWYKGEDGGSSEAQVLRRVQPSRIIP